MERACREICSAGQSRTPEASGESVWRTTIVLELKGDEVGATRLSAQRLGQDGIRPDRSEEGVAIALGHEPCPRALDPAEAGITRQRPPRKITCFEAAV